MNEQQKKTKFQIVSEWAEEFWPEIVYSVGAIYFAVLQVYLSVQATGWRWFITLPGLIFSAAVIVCCIAVVEACRRKPRSRQLRDTVAILENSLHQAQLDVYTLFENQLSLLVNSVLKYSDTERVSIYKHNGKAFVMLGRYSQNPQYIKRGRGIYPDDEGCIARAWQSGHAHIDELPDPIANFQDYAREQQSNWGIKEAIVTQFKVKSRSYTAFAIFDVRRERRIAVIVFESTRTNVLNYERLRSVIEMSEGQRLARFLEKVQPLEPTPEYAQREGF